MCSLFIISASSLVDCDRSKGMANGGNNYALFGQSDFVIM